MVVDEVTKAVTVDIAVTDFVVVTVEAGLVEVTVEAGWVRVTVEAGWVVVVESVSITVVLWVLKDVRLNSRRTFF